MRNINQSLTRNWNKSLYIGSGPANADVEDNGEHRLNIDKIGAWIRDPKVFLDRGRLLPGEEPLLKERRYLRKDAAEQLWRSLQSQGWKPLKKAAWGSSAEV